MTLPAILDPFAKGAAATVMTRMATEWLIDEPTLEALFQQVADVQYTRELTLTHLVHIAFLKLGGADEHVFHVLDLVVSGVAFAFVGACIPGIGRRARPNPSGQGSAARWCGG